MAFPKFPFDRHSKKLSHNDRYALACQYLTDVISFENCKRKASGSLQTEFTQCSCLHTHLTGNDELFKAVALEITEYVILHREQKCSNLIMNVKYANAFCGAKNPKKKFVLPRRGYCVPALDPVCLPCSDNSETEAGVASDSKKDTVERPYMRHDTPVICQNALMTIYGLGVRPWKQISKAAIQNQATVIHANKGKMSNANLKPAVVDSLSKFFESLKPLGMPRASRIVRIECGEAFLRDDDDKLIELPLHWSERSLWARWMNSLGFLVTTNNFGFESIRWNPEIPRPVKLPEYCQRKCFLKYWRKNYPEMVLGSTRTDICDDCWVWGNSITKLKGDMEGEICPIKLAKLSESRQTQMLSCQKHLRRANAQRDLVDEKVLESKATSNNEHGERKYTYIIDYCQNMGLPWFGGQQPGKVFFYSPVNVYCLGCVDQNDSDKSHLIAHLYTEANGGKGSNNVASLLFKTLNQKGVLKEGEKAGEINICMDNCGGQNKNRMVLRMALFLVEMGYAKTVRFIFYIKGHTKNEADRLFNLLKRLFHKSNVYTFDCILEVLAGEQKSVWPVKEGEFEDWDKFLDTYYTRFPGGETRKNHIFEVSADRPTTIRVCAADGEVWKDIEMKKKSDKRSQMERVAAMRTHLRSAIPFPGLRDIKKVEMQKYKKLVDPKYQSNKLYDPPSPEAMAKFKVEKAAKDQAKRRALAVNNKVAKVAKHK